MGRGAPTPLLPLVLVLACSTLGCGPEFDPSNEIQTIRVMGVQKDRPYAQPGDEVSLQMLWHDPKGRTDVQRAWIGGCVNPPGDLYYGCFAQQGAAADPGSELPFGFGDSFKVQIPSDIISGRQGPFEPGQRRYGLYIVFFVVCAGQLSFDMNVDPEAAGSTGLPIRCLDADEQPLGSEDFIVGYSSIYSFADVDNENPSFSPGEDGKGEFLIEENLAPGDCLGADCQGAAAVEVDCSDPGEPRCIEACEDDGEPSCPAIDVAPRIEQLVETDPVTSELYGSDVTEQMWVNYYVDRGAINEVRLLNDATAGWNAKYRGQLRAPKDPGPLQIWAVAHDNRGGMQWSRVTLQVR
jgi:hypothetical protein